jgi:hypothetical protein
MLKSHGLMLKVAALGILTGAPVTAVLADDSGLTWVIEPYLWAPSISTRLNVDVPPIQQNNTTSFPDLISKVGFAGQLHFEVQGDNFGALADGMYISLNDSRNQPRFSSRSKVSTGVYELAGVWSPGENRFEGFEAFAGVRSFDASFDFTFTPTNPIIPQARIDLDKTWTDFLVGARYTLRFTPRWAMTFRLDGGFGDTDTNFNTSILGSYRTGNGAWLFGYRYMDTKFAVSGRDLDLKMYGPQIAYAFVF